MLLRSMNLGSRSHSVKETSIDVYENNVTFWYLILNAHFKDLHLFIMISDIVGWCLYEVF